MNHKSTEPDNVKLSCRRLWKVFGPGAEQLLRINSSPDSDDLATAGLIGAVRNVNIDIREGEIFIIMGLSGSGKSTVVRCLSRLIEPSAGEIMFEGRNLLEASEKELIEIRRHKMGMVFQHFALLPHLTVLGNVAFPLEIQGVDRNTREKRAMEIIELVGLEGRESYYPRELSGGQQQRVGIGRSLAVEPEIWFLDEPFSALDPLIRREMQDEFLRLQSVLKKSIAFITHDFDEAIRLADRIAIMKDGEVIQIGSPEELITQPATDYVAEFTKDVSRAKVLTVKTMATEPEDGKTYTDTVHANEKIETIAEQILNSDRVFGVVDESGQIIGEIKREDVTRVLIGSA
ncbi:betaine/proline/choline family ABC transporter ATP-binding protein [Gammaproteobacteria bacterium]|nr:betaine/proline/choline family ABC transporter ATP-binding protein [Gammaproteobacteria bacterium]